MESSVPTYKQLTLSNWQEPDPTSQQFGMRSPIVGMRQMDGNDWARQILEVELGRQVPDDVRDVFGVARGCLVYGWFFYPLFRLGEEQLFRVAEMAVRERARQLGHPRPKKPFAKLIEDLVELGAIDERDHDWWTALRKLRNDSSHPTHTVVMLPGGAVRSLARVSHEVNRLFGRDRSQLVGPD